MKRNKAEARAAILYDPTPANGKQMKQWAKDSMSQAYATRREGPEPEGHGAAEWERQAQGLSLWATLELRNTAWIKESQAKEVAYNLGLI